MVPTIFVTAVGVFLYLARVVSCATSVFAATGVLMRPGASFAIGVDDTGLLIAVSGLVTADAILPGGELSRQWVF